MTSTDVRSDKFNISYILKSNDVDQVVFTISSDNLATKIYTVQVSFILLWLLACLFFQNVFELLLFKHIGQ